VDTRDARAYLTLNEADPVKRAAYLGDVGQLTVQPVSTPAGKELSYET